MHLKLRVAALALFLGTVALGQGPPTRMPSAKDEAIPALRDASVVILRHVRVIDGTGAPAKEDQALVIRGDKILALGIDSGINAPAITRTLHPTALSVVLAMVMLHEHLFVEEV